MVKQLDPEIQKKWHELTTQSPQPEWLQEMHRHYRETGTYRQVDLRRLLGDPNQRVEIGPNSSLASAMAERLKGN